MKRQGVCSVSTISSSGPGPGILEKVRATKSTVLQLRKSCCLGIGGGISDEYGIRRQASVGS